jgi:hypothetical protein
MKTKLFTTLLMLATIPFFAQNASSKPPIKAIFLKFLKDYKAAFHEDNIAQPLNQYPTKSELLAHLKSFLKEYIREDDQLEQLIGKPWPTDVYMKKVSDEFLSQSTTLQAIADNWKNDIFDLIVNQMFDIKLFILLLMYYEVLPIKEQTKLELYQIFKPIYNKHYTDYRNNHPNEYEITAPLYDEFEDCLQITCELNFDEFLITKINTKIAELECNPETLVKQESTIVTATKNYWRS